MSFGCAICRSFQLPKDYGIGLDAFDGSWSVAPCGHASHEACLQRYNKRQCPVCRQPVKAYQHFYPISVLEEEVDSNGTHPSGQSHGVQCNDERQRLRAQLDSLSRKQAEEKAQQEKLIAQLVRDLFDTRRQLQARDNYIALESSRKLENGELAKVKAECAQLSKVVQELTATNAQITQDAHALLNDLMGAK